MDEIGKLIRSLRIEAGYPLRKVAAYLDIDQAILSKMERGKRKFSKEQVLKLARLHNYDEQKMLKTYLSDKIIYEIGKDKLALEALEVAEEKIAYYQSKKINKKEIVNQIKSIIKNFPKVYKAWIYGSFARGDDTYASDIDIAIEANGKMSYFDLAEIQYHIEKKTGKKTDIGFIDAFKPHILENIQADLKLVYEQI